MRGLRRRLRPGDWVEVRARSVLLATLTDGCLDGLPLMPQMLAMAGQRFQVHKRAHKTCDTVNRTGGRRMSSTVHLVGQRCDGAAYDGCGAACLLFWKEAWLERVDGPSTSAVAVAVRVRAATVDDADVWAATRAADSTDEETVYSCQATKLPDATAPLAWWDLRQYVEDVTSGNVTAREMCGGVGYVVSFNAYRVARRLRLGEPFIRAYDAVQRRRGGVPFPRRHGRIERGQPTPTVSLGVSPGDRVRVRPFGEILETLDSWNQNRGLFFDAEEVPYCGKEMTVRSRVERIIDERSGRMIPIGRNTVILDDAICMGHYSDRRMFCPREIFSFWRETWLEPEPSGTADRS